MGQVAFNDEFDNYNNYEHEICDDLIGKSAMQYCNDTYVLSKCDRRFKAIADKINYGECDSFDSQELEDFFMPIVNKVKSDCAVLSEHDGGKQTAAYLLGLKALSKDFNKYLRG